MRSNKRQQELFFPERHQSAPCFIIAEAGVNHNGRLDLAYDLIRVASQTGADAVKFQLFNPETLASKSAPLANYQETQSKQNTSQRDLLESLTLPKEVYPELKRYAESLGLTFLCSPFDEDSAYFLVRHCRVEIIKLASGELTNTPFLAYLKTLKTPLILSTGMANLDEIWNALLTLGKNCPVALLHCVSAYPTPSDQVNLKAITTLKNTFPQYCIGFSDHTISEQTPALAVALGAKIIEKHLTLDRNMSGPDHAASFEPEQFRRMVEQIRDAERMLGSGQKIAQPCEQDCLKVARKSVVAARMIEVGQILKREDLCIKRPGTGISPSHLEQLLGRQVLSPILKDTLITPEQLEEGFPFVAQLPFVRSECRE